MKKLSILFMLLLFCSFFPEVFAAPANPNPFTINQSNGKRLTLTLKGDEKLSWATTSDGYTLLRLKNGDFVYAIKDNKGDLVPSDIIACDAQERTEKENNFVSSLEKGLLFSKEQISMLKQIWNISEDYNKKRSLKSKNGTTDYKMVVVLMEFPNQKFKYKREDFDNMFNQVGYTFNGNNGSVKDYFLASTFNQINISAKVVGPYTASKDYGYYGENVGNYKDYNVRDLISEAVLLADNEVNYKEYCNNNSRKVDCIYVIYAGYSESSYGNEPNTIWPHRSQLQNAINKDGVDILDYACSSEIGGNPKREESPVVGTICHEFSHVLGLPDLYDTDYGASGGEAAHPGEWDLMASGNYNNGGKCPPLWSAFERSLLGLMEIEELQNSGNKTLPPLDRENFAYKMSFSEQEYFIIENRKQHSWDTYLPSSGMLIYHVDKNVSGWNTNCANCNPENMGYFLEAANLADSFYHYKRYYNAFPSYEPFNDSFRDNTVPSSLSNSGDSLKRPLSNIMINQFTSNINFDYGYLSPNAPIAKTNKIIETYSDSILVSVSFIQNSSFVLEKGICYSKSNKYPTLSSDKQIETKNGINFSVVLKNLTPSTIYYVRAYSLSANDTSYGEIIKVTTQCTSIKTFPFIYGFDSEESNRDCWAQQSSLFLANNWRYVSEADFGEPLRARNGEKFAFIKSDFTPSRWENNQITKLVSPPLDITGLSKPTLSFNYILKSKSNNQDTLKVYYKKSNNDDWKLLGSFYDTTSSWQAAIVAITQDKTSTFHIAFEANLFNGYGIALDNIIIEESDKEIIPLVNTLSLDNITDISASISAKVEKSGSSNLVSTGLCWSIYPSPTIYDDLKESEVAQLGQMSLNIQSLMPNTKYYLRAFAKNETSVGYGEQVEIVTHCERITQFPYVVRNDDFSSDCIKKENNWEVSMNDIWEIGLSYKSNIIGEKSRAILPIIDFSNRENNILSFSYLQPEFGGNIDTLKIYYKLSANGQWILLKTYEESYNELKRDSVLLPFVSGEYYLAFEGISNLGGGVFIYDIILNGDYQLPTIETKDVMLTSYNSINVTADVLSQGLSSLTEKGVIWGNKSGLNINNSTKIISESSLGEFNIKIDNLNALSTYFVNTYAINSFGISYGEEKSIKTLSIPISNNVISGDHEICNNSINLTQTIYGSNPEGGDNSFSYRWIESFDKELWRGVEDSVKTNNKDFFPYKASQTTYLRRIVYSGLSTDTSNIVSITVYQNTRGGNVFPTKDTVEINESVRIQLRAYIGSILKWQRKQNNTQWEDLYNSEDSIYFTDFPNNGGTWYYRAIVKSGTCQEAISGEDKVYVKRNIGLDGVELNSEDFIVYPNPSNGEIKIIYKGKETFLGDLFIRDINGKDVRILKNICLKEGVNVLDVNPIANGTYVIICENTNKILSTKLLIQR